MMSLRFQDITQVMDHDGVEIVIPLCCILYQSKLESLHDYYLRFQDITQVMDQYTSVKLGNLLSLNQQEVILATKGEVW